MLIDCDGCAVRGSACDDCVVTLLLAAPAAGADPEPAGVDATRHAVALDLTDRRALRALADAGLVPHLRHERPRSA